ncbi:MULTISPECIES: hypothetical protein [unclassified Pseudoclavibacter]|uniref:hypothetical protein n=1 Tax=unclassified Pseudoclavibacter TaxID=2615177 RepID=UPI001BA667B3|nr:hypothetical protein [Pseudoclavibacter sp. Marseille-Q4354]MBS3180151.1 hypothetical protein [Pseudoclavibacter sp. Marseille-Q4354]
MIDSFWTDRVPRVARDNRYYDHIYVTDPDDIAGWEDAGVRSVSSLPWGADALRMPFREARATDLQRIGRQPDAWDDDEQTAAAASEFGMAFRGRPPFEDSDDASQKRVDDATADAKFVLAFSNRSHQSSYTHPTREYLTGRWLNALAAGASVAGIAPRTAVAEQLLWPGSCLELSSTDRAIGLEEISAALANWTPGAARENRRRALERLDWRHRLAVLATDFNLDAPRLQRSLREVALAADNLASSA